MSEHYKLAVKQARELSVEIEAQTLDECLEHKAALSMVALLVNTAACLSDIRAPIDALLQRKATLYSDYVRCAHQYEGRKIRADIKHITMCLPRSDISTIEYVSRLAHARDTVPLQRAEIDDAYQPSLSQIDFALKKIDRDIIALFTGELYRLDCGIEYERDGVVSSRYIN